MGTQQGSPTCSARITLNGWTYPCQKVALHYANYHWWNRPDVVGIQGNTPVQRIKWYREEDNNLQIWIDDGRLEFAAI